MKKIVTLQRIWRHPETHQVHTCRVAIDLFEITQVEEYNFEREINFHEYGDICYIDTIWVRGQMFTVSFDDIVSKWKKELSKKRIIVRQINEN